MVPEQKEKKKNIVNGIEIPQLHLNSDPILSVDAQSVTLTPSPSEPWIFAPIAITIQKMTMKKPPLLHEEAETKFAFFMQTLIPFICAGYGLICAGLLLEKAETWTFFQSLPDVVILVPTLLGLKGNLEMTLGSRLSTLANLGFMETSRQKWEVATSNLALIQCQAIVIASIAVIPASLFGEETTFSDMLCLLISSVATASIASLILGVVMIAVVIVAREKKVNPDNIVTPVAASLGDVATLLILIVLGTFLIRIRENYHYLLIVAVFVFYVVASVCASVARKDQFTSEVLRHGWWSILMAMAITLLGGFLLKLAMHKYPPIAAFQPLVNGVGGNLVGVQASRISTGLHRARKNRTKETSALWVHASPYHAFIQNNEDSIAARILVAISVPGNLLFMNSIFLIGCGFSLTFSFTAGFLFVGLVQVSFLLYLCQFLVRLLWKLRIDPDNSAIPILTAIGDLLGCALLFGCFSVLSIYFHLPIAAENFYKPH